MEQEYEIKIPPEIKWEAKEFKKRPKNKNWFIGLWTTVVILIIIAALIKNFLLIVILLLSGFLFYIYSIKEPKTYQFSLSNEGIRIGNNLYEYKDLRSFWINYNPPDIKELSIRGKKTIMPYLTIPIGDKDPVLIREYLLQYLDEQEHKQSLIDIIMHNLGF